MGINKKYKNDRGKVCKYKGSLLSYYYYIGTQCTLKKSLKENWKHKSKVL